MKKMLGAARKRPLALLGALLLLPLPLAAATLTVYDDQLQNGFSDWSWATRSLAQTGVVHSGTAAISWEPDDWEGLFLHRDAGISTTAYDTLELWVHGGPGGGQNVSVALILGGSVAGTAQPLAGFVTGGAIPAGAWAKAVVPFASLGVTPGTQVDGFWLQDGSGGDQATVYVDDVAFTGPDVPPAPLTVSVDASLDRRAISPLIFGVNWGSDAQMARMKWPVRRWGGNRTSRYNWQLDVDNSANDWFFTNYANPDPGTLPHGSAADDFVDATRAAGGQPWMTVPMLGWTPRDRVRRWGFSVAKYGAQQTTECTYFGANPPDWCQPDAGNGCLTSSPPGGCTPLTGNDPADTSIAVGVPFATGWTSHMAGRTGTAGAGGVRFLGLDNEPALWNSTHRDVHPEPLDYDELWQKTRDYAAAMKAQDPGVETLGPGEWGWCGYFYSAADGCAPGADWAAHGNQSLAQWYLSQLAQYDAANGVRLLDYYDLHFYPQGTNVALTTDESAATSARRLRALKELYDPTWVSESWIGQAGAPPIRLIPMMRELRETHYPGTKLAIGEYNFGDGGISSAMAQAEALAIFGREGLDLATRWSAPDEDTLVEDAFALFLDYDGAGSQVAGTSVRATSSNVDLVGSYAVHGRGSTLYLLLFNKDTADQAVTVSAAGGLTGDVTLFRFTSAARLGPAGSAATSGGTLALTLPARSATLGVATLAAPPPAATRFHTLAPCRLFDSRWPAGPLGAPAATGAAPRTVAHLGACGLPASARALSVNVTAVNPTADGFLTVHPADLPPPATSTVNFRTGKVRANNAIVGLSPAGAFVVRAGLSGSVDVIVDVNGWFE
ncbi:MAG: hypothetical protein EDX89_19085 [Acidobacteria bacterium]|nr:MAG: hypothetical protein EDX89_19085 [Acidobacteriota bacterium]